MNVVASGPRDCFSLSRFYASVPRRSIRLLLSHSLIPAGWANPSRRRLTILSIQHGEGDFIAVRAHRDGANDLPEFSIVIEDTQNARAIHATLREAQGSSLYQQLATLHANDPSKSYAELKPDLKVHTWNRPAGQCPAIAAQLKAFNNVQFVRQQQQQSRRRASHPLSIPRIG